MNWIQTHMTLLLALWVTVWTIANAVAGIAKPDSAAGKVAHVVLALSPFDVVKAWKAIGAQMVPPTLLLLAFLGASVQSCTPAERAPIEHALGGALTDENLACLFKDHIPGDNPQLHTWIASSCVIGPIATQAALALLEAADRLHIGDKPDAGGGG